jgi:hypothetical protein
MISFTWSELFLCFIGAEDVQLEKGEDREQRRIRAKNP